APTDPNTPEYRLRADLAKYRRAKGKGLPPRYRLFWIFSTTAKVIIYLYLNDAATLRTEGARTDPYVRFRRLIDRGSIGPDFESNLRAWQQPLTE
nr:type II toxin-antitoxin system YhaV family toxin [Chloroflexota bacterium]